MAEGSCTNDCRKDPVDYSRRFHCSHFDVVGPSCQGECHCVTTSRDRDVAISILQHFLLRSEDGFPDSSCPNVLFRGSGDYDSRVRCCSRNYCGVWYSSTKATIHSTDGMDKIC